MNQIFPIFKNMQLCGITIAIKKGRGGPTKTIREIIRNILEVNKLDLNLVYDRTI